MTENAVKIKNRPDWVRPIRYLVRVPLLLLHAIVGLPLTLIFVTPIGERIKIGDDDMRQRMIRWWSGVTCWIFGFRIQVIGRRQPGPAMLVANHVSWLDIEMIHSQVAAGFVAKAEIAGWPLIGWMAKAGGTIFHRRGSDNSSRSVSDGLNHRLTSGQVVAIFAEGRTGPGDRILPFHGRLLQAAIDTESTIQPVALRYSRQDQIVNHRVAFGPKENFVINLLRVLGDPPTKAEIIFLDVIEPDGQPRKELANQAHQQVSAQFS